MSRIHYIYGLSDPFSGVIRYIGKSVNPEYRLRNHLKFRIPGNHKQSWLESLRKLGLRPEIVIIQAESASNIDEAERFWIAEYRSRGFSLLNVTNGGDGGATWTGKHLSVEHRKKISSSNIGKKNKLGFKDTTETRKKRSQVKIGNKHALGNKMVSRG